MFCGSCGSLREQQQAVSQHGDENRCSAGDLRLPVCTKLNGVLYFIDQKGKFLYEYEFYCSSMTVKTQSGVVHVVRLNSFGETC